MEGAKILMPRVIIIGRKGRVIYVLDVMYVRVYIYIYTEEGSIIANETNTTPDRDRCLEMAS